MTPSLVPVHLVVYDCKSPQALEQYKQLATGSGARYISYSRHVANGVGLNFFLSMQCRCHAYCPPAPVPCDSRKNPLLSSLSSLSSIGSSSPPQRRPASGRSTSSVNTNKSRPQSAIASMKTILQLYSHSSPSLFPLHSISFTVRCSTSL